MTLQVILVEVLLAGFLAIACLRASIPSAEGSLRLSDLLRFPSRIERLRRSRWQWFSMVALLLVLRLQESVPLVLEVMAAVVFLLFLAVPTQADTPGTASHARDGLRRSARH